MYVYSVISNTTVVWGFLSAYRGSGWFEVYLVCSSREGHPGYLPITRWSTRYIKVREGNGMLKGHYIWRKDGEALLFSETPQEFVPMEVKELRIVLQQEGYQSLIH